MDQYLLFAVVGLGFGCIYAGVAMGVVITYRGTGIINFATGSMAMWGAYVYDELGRTGDLVIPVVIIPHRIPIMTNPPWILQFVLAVLSCTLIGLIVHFAVFRPLRNAPTLAKVVSSVGVLLTLQSLVVLQFASTPRAVPPIMPNEVVTMSGISFARDRLWITLVVVLFAIGLWAYFRFTRIGLATRAAAENERAASLARFSPQFLAGSTWVLSSTVVGIIVILTSPMTILNPLTYTFAIVPALAAALIGRLQSIAVTVAAALALGSFQSIVTFQSSKDWWPDWAITGLADAVPFVVIIVALFIVGDRLPTRGAIESDPLPEVIRPVLTWARVLTAVGVGVLAIVLTDGSWRFGVITSMIVAIIMLSLVLLTGLIGQISLAQAAIAGTAGFALSKLADDAGVPFPIAPILAALIAGVFGVIVGIPALRIRGAQLAVVTLAGAVALERFIFRNPELSNAAGNLIPDAEIFGLSLAVREGRTIARVEFGLFVLVVLTVMTVVVANLGRSATGRRFLAVRSNERAGAASGIDVSANKLLAFGLASILAGVGGVLIGYSRGQLSADSFATLVGLSFLAFAYLGGITSISGALIAGTFAPLGIGFVFFDRVFDLGRSYGLVAGIGLVLTAILNPEGIAGANRKNWAALRARFGAEVDDRGARANLLDRTGHETDGNTAADAGPAAANREPRERGELLLSVEGLTVRYGGLIANESIDLQVHRGTVVGLIGPNGAGKTTFIDALTGFTPYTGSVSFSGQSIDDLGPHRRARAGLTRTWQSLEIFTDLTVEENLRVSSERASTRSVLLDLINPGRPIDLEQVEWAMDLLGLGGLRAATPNQLSLGQQKLVGVARALSSRPDVVLLDEPAAGLDTAESNILGARLSDIVDNGIAVLLVDHDMGLVLDVCDYIYVLDFGRLIAQGTPAEIRNDDVVIEAYLGEEGRRAKEDAFAAESVAVRSAAAEDLSS